ncbi:uncharacterized protein BXZ73DRAFT_96308 [Epithele typhae]|uniref:uncharacterized protein n=1 Tax=Epithele typhae TaxID=378194 RepID=UPI002008E58C|nr:uncharacterized protein BXZ73DRAFT_96308 [Epithele typhae]KAH9945322.1 hypothetical protein BXZ73DRAFT_96308 [Epithele typhae]
MARKISRTSSEMPPIFIPETPPVPFYRTRTAGDIVIRSSDRVDFRLHKDALAAASPSFATRFAPQQPDPTTDAPPSPDATGPIVTSESAAVWELLIPILYSRTLPFPFLARLAAGASSTDLDALRALLDAGRTYQCADAVGTCVSNALLLTRTTIDRSPVGVYALARAFELPALTHAAARASLRERMYLSGDPRLKLISGEDYHRLLDYRRRCADAARARVCGHAYGVYDDEHLPHGARRLPGGSLHFLDASQPASAAFRDAVRRAGAGTRGTSKYGLDDPVTKFVSVSGVQLHPRWSAFLDRLHGELKFDPDDELARAPGLERELLGHLLADACSARESGYGGAAAPELAELFVAALHGSLKAAIDAPSFGAAEPSSNAGGPYFKAAEPSLFFRADATGPNDDARTPHGACIGPSSSYVATQSRSLVRGNSSFGARV